MLQFVITTVVAGAFVLVVLSYRRSESRQNPVVDEAARREEADLPCPWCGAATTEDDPACPSCGRRFGAWSPESLTSGV